MPDRKQDRKQERQRQRRKERLENRPPPVKPVEKERIPQITLHEIKYDLSFKEIVVPESASKYQGSGIMGNNDVTVPELRLSYFDIDAKEYGMYCLAKKVILDHCKIHSRHYYAARGQWEELVSNHTSWKGEHSFRIYGCRKGSCKHDTFDVDWFMWGGGGEVAANEQIESGGTEEAPYLFEDCTIKANHFNIYRATHWTTFRRCVIDSWDIYLWGGCTNIRFEGCTNPDGTPFHWGQIKLGGDADDEPVSQQEAIRRGIAVTP